MVDTELIRHAKYPEETYPLSLNFVLRLRTGQTIVSATVTVTHCGNDVTSQFIGNVTTSTQVVTLILLAAGTRGQFYIIRVLANTQNDIYEQVIELEVK